MEVKKTGNDSGVKSRPAHDLCPPPPRTTKPVRATRKKSRHELESREQMAFFHWFRHAFPEVEALSLHVPNGGQRDAITGARLKKEGVKAGVPDILILHPRGKYHGCAIELKATPVRNWLTRKLKRGRATLGQRVWLDNLNAQGYFAVLCHGLDEIKARVEEYMALPVNKTGENQ